MSDLIDIHMLERLQATIHECNPYIEFFKTIASSIENHEMQILLKACKKGLQRGRYNLPTTQEIVAIIPRDGSEELSPRDIKVQLCNGGIQHILDLHQAYIPLHFVLLFPYGEPGWQTDINSKG
jgi:hypothetical protein